MKASDVVDICNTAIPRAGEWHKAKGEPYGPYKVSPNMEVKRVLYCVTPTKEIQAHFYQKKYDLLISHHPYIAKYDPQLVYHTALDCCPGGLNDQWREALGMQNASHFDGNLGWVGDIEPTSFDGLVRKVAAFSGGVEGQVYAEPWLNTVKRVAICTGLGGIVSREARETGADVYIMGENVMPARMVGTPGVIETGHTLSEWMGVNLFRKLLEPHGVQVDSPPVQIDYFGGEIYQPNKYAAMLAVATPAQRQTLSEHGIVEESPVNRKTTSFWEQDWSWAQ